MKSVYGGVDLFPLDWIFPLNYAKFGPIEVNIPAQSEKVLRKKYGEDCFSSAMPPVWDHRLERLTYFPPHRTSLNTIYRAFS